MDNSGDRGSDGFVSFVIASQEPLLRMAYTLTGDRGAAEDLVQTSLMRTYAHWPRVHAQDPYAYTRRIIINANHDAWRRHRGRDRVGEGEPTVVRDHASGVVDRDAVISALAELTDRERTVVVLRYLLDFSEADTARELGLKPGTIKSTTARAFDKLRTSHHLTRASLESLA